MYSLYLNAIGREATSALNEKKLGAEHINRFYSSSGTDVQKFIDYAADGNSCISVMANADFYYLTDCKVTKYAAKNQEGKFDLLEYEYDRCFPVCVRFSIIIADSIMDRLNLAESLLNNYFMDGKCISVNHPILEKHELSIRLKANDGIRSEKVVGENSRPNTLTIFFDAVNMPWFFDNWSKEAVFLSNRSQMQFIEQLIALLEICDNCKANNLPNNMSNIIINHINSMYEIACLPDNTRNIKRLRQILKGMKENKFGIIESIHKIETEELLIKQREAEKERQRLLQQQAEIEREQARYYREESYYDEDSGSHGHGVLRSILGAAAEVGRNRPSRSRNDNRSRSNSSGKRDYYGTANCVRANGKGHACMECPMFWHCTRDHY